MKSSSALDRLWSNGREFLNVKYPIMCGAMTWISGHSLVATVSNAGGFGILAAGNLPPEKLEEEIRLTREATKKPFAVNLITIAPHYQAHIEIASSMKVPWVIFAGSLPKKSEIQRVKKEGLKAVSFASTDSIARQMLKFGADALILEGSEAGGHVGHVSLTILLQTVLFNYGDKVPIFVAGGIGTGRMMAHLLLMGASGVQLGTRFVMSSECSAHSKFKEAFMRARAREAVVTPQYDSRLPVVAVRALKNQAMQSFGKLQLQLLQELDGGKITRKEAQYKVESFWIEGLRKAVVEGNLDEGSLMAGQSVGLTAEIKPVAGIIAELIEDAEAALESVSSRISGSI